MAETRDKFFEVARECVGTGWANEAVERVAAILRREFLFKTTVQEPTVSEQKWTQEPWEYLDDPPRIVSASHPDYCVAQYLQEGNAKRIIACVEALRGIPAEELATLASDLVKCTDCFTQEEIDSVLSHPDLDDEHRDAMRRILALSDLLRREATR